MLQKLEAQMEKIPTQMANFSTPKARGERFGDLRSQSLGIAPIRDQFQLAIPAQPSSAACIRPSTPAHSLSPPIKIVGRMRDKGQTSLFVRIQGNVYLLQEEQPESESATISLVSITRDAAVIRDRQGISRQIALDTKSNDSVSNAVAILVGKHWQKNSLEVENCYAIRGDLQPFRQ